MLGRGLTLDFQSLRRSELGYVSELGQERQKRDRKDNSKEYIGYGTKELPDSAIDKLITFYDQQSQTFLPPDAKLCNIM